MTAYYADDLVTLHHGDCLEVLRGLPDCSVDAVVTDPPYDLTSGNGGGFMGKRWDATGIAFDPATWLECLRILKPGGHLLAFGGSRTWHRLAAAVEDAGFEIRDSIAWLYGSGFPKSMDVSKAIDKIRDDEAEIRAVCRWLRARIDDHPEQTIASIADRFGFNARMVEYWAARDTDSQPAVPKLDQWDMLRDVLDFDDEMDAEVYRLNVRKGEPGEAWQDRPIVGEVEEWTDRTNYALTSRDGLRRGESTNPIARQWAGWGTALKPAFEPIVVGRKPLAGTVAQTVLAHGTGALNIDGCRIDARGELSPQVRGSQVFAETANGRQTGWNREDYNGDYTPNPGGRWPTNVLLDDAAAAELDRQSGTLTSGLFKGNRTSDKTRGVYGKFKGDPDKEVETYGDSGGASRFFPTFKYQAKAPTSERPNVDGVQHPTVKPIDLMRWLVRLVTPPGAVVLEPFAGSGTTAEACVLENRRCIAIEREADYLPLITSRLTKPAQQGLDFGDLT